MKAQPDLEPGRLKLTQVRLYSRNMKHRGSSCYFKFISSQEKFSTLLSSCLSNNLSSTISLFCFHVNEHSDIFSQNSVFFSFQSPAYSWFLIAEWWIVFVLLDDLDFKSCNTIMLKQSSCVQIMISFPPISKMNVCCLKCYEIYC